MPRPPFGSPEWLPYFLEVVNTSKTVDEAVTRLGYAHSSVIYYHLKKFGIARPPQWNERPWLREIMQRKIPVVIIPTTTGRLWVAGLTQGEGCFQARFYRQYDVTYFNIDLSMADPEPVFKFSDYVGLSHPSKPIKNHDWKPNWHKNVSGLRAFRVLHEIYPFLLGEKLKEAEKALAFFAPHGSHVGCFGNLDVWPTNEFPWRTKRRGSTASSLTGTRIEYPMDSWSTKSQFESENLTTTAGSCGQVIRPLNIGLMNRGKVPEVIITSVDDRVWVGGLVQGEATLESHYIKMSDSTTLILGLRMTDPYPVSRFADLCGLPRPDRPTERPNRWQPIWRKDISGIRALRVLKEIQPFLVGQKLRESQRALEFFDLNGYHKGRFYSLAIWPPDKFPFRRHPMKNRVL